MIRTIIVLFLTSTLICSAQSLLDPSFDPGTGAGDGFIESMVVQPDGKILACGSFTSFNGANKGYVVRLNPDGSVDNSFTADVGYWVRHMALQSDGKIVIGGFFNNVGVYPHSCIARLNSDGSVDPTFDPGDGAVGTLGVSITGNPDPFVFQVAIQPTDGKILITGNFTNVDGVDINGIARLNTDGSIDTTFHVGSGMSTWGRSIQVLPNGQILATGWFDNYNNSQHNRMALINPDGSPDNSFLPFFGDRTAIYTAAKLPNGQYIAAGHSLNFDGLFTNEIRRVNIDGTQDTSYPAGADEKIQMVHLQTDGKLLMCGEFTEVNGETRYSMARLNADGTLDPSFSADIDNWAWSIITQPDGRILLCGGFSTVDGVPRNCIARFLPNSSFVPAPSIVKPRKTGNNFSVSVATSNGKTYSLQYVNSLVGSSWTTLTSVGGDGTTKTLSDNSASTAARFYRVVMN